MNTPPPQIFTGCLARAGHARGFDRPFLLDNRLYATDGHIIVRGWPGRFSGEPMHPGFMPILVDELKHWTPDAVRGIVPVALPSVGSGITACEHCSNGRREAGVGDHMACCWNCEGARFTKDRRTSDIGGGVLLAAHRIALLRRNDVMEAWPIQIPMCGPDHIPTTVPAAYFISRDFDGIVMGCRKEAR